MSVRKLSDGGPLRPQNVKKSLSVEAWAKKLMQQSEELSCLDKQNSSGDHSRLIERIYSKKEIRCHVAKNLIPLYQNDDIIDAVTDFLYAVHVTK